MAQKWKKEKQHEMWDAMLESIFITEVECRAKSSSHVSSVYLGRSLQANELTLVCSLIGVFTNVHTQIWFNQGQAMHPDQRRMAPSAINGAHSFYHHMCCIIALNQGWVQPNASFWHSEVLSLSARYTIGQQDMANGHWQMIVSHTCCRTGGFQSQMTGRTIELSKFSDLWEYSDFKWIKCPCTSDMWVDVLTNNMLFILQLITVMDKICHTVCLTHIQCCSQLIYSDIYVSFSAAVG